MTALRTLAIALAGTLLSGAAAAAKLRVENHGVDAPGCGTQQAPCRSISQAVANAAEGDAILVGPGFYGDLDGDGSFGEVGEEGPAAATCDCLVLIDKRVSIRSTEGAAATVLVHPSVPLRAFRLTAEGAAVGKRNGGFSIVGELGTGLLLEADGNAAAGNWLVDETVSANGGDASLSDNRLLGGEGILAVGAGARLVRNAVAVAAQGFILGLADAALPRGAPRRLERSVAVGNLIGVFVDSDVGPTEMERCAALGNSMSGVYVSVNEDTTASRLSLYGNGAGETTSPAPNCGLAAAIAVPAPRSFWGAPAGPGADPADAACPVDAGSIEFAPVSAKEIRVKLRPLR
jgi:hypothetical protein